MGIPCARGTSVVLPYCSHGISMGPWVFCGASTMSPWDFYGIPVGLLTLPWDSHVLPLDSYGTSMGRPWDWHGDSYFPWDFRNVLMGLPWDFLGVLTGLPWHFLILIVSSWCSHGVPTGLLRWGFSWAHENSMDFRGVPMGLPRDFHGNFYFPRDFCGASMMLPWNPHEASLVCPWDLHEPMGLPLWSHGVITMGLP